jgi:gliding motility-associated-like protein
LASQTYAWYTQAVGGSPIQNLATADFVTPSLSATTSYFVSIQSATNESVRVEVVATVNPLPAQPSITINGNTALCIERQDNVTLVAPTGFAQYRWSTNETTEQIVVTDAGSYTVQVTGSNGCESVASSAVLVTSQSCSELIVYNGISANDDALNSYLRIENIDAFPETKANHLKIYNRWGDLVFEISNYDNVNNKFTGIGKNGNELPAGTYFYKLEFDSGRPGLTGYLALKR